MLEVRNRSGFYEILITSDETPFSSFVQNSRGAGKGKVHSFGKRDQAIKRNLNVPVVVRGWLYKQVSWASLAALHLHGTLFFFFFLPFHRSFHTASLCSWQRMELCYKDLLFLNDFLIPITVVLPVLWFSLKMWIQTCQCCILWTAAMLRLSPLHLQDSSGMRLWKRKWFVLSDYCLFYYKGESLKGHAVGHGW